MSPEEASAILREARNVVREGRPPPLAWILQRDFLGRDVVAEAWQQAAPGPMFFLLRHLDRKAFDEFLDNRRPGRTEQQDVEEIRRLRPRIGLDDLLARCLPHKC